MGFIDFFRRKKYSAKTKTTNSLEISYISANYSLLRIPELNLIGRYSKSPNGEYIVIAEDADYKSKSASSRSGFRKSGTGRCVLIKENKMIYQVDIDRPHKPAVADSGVAVVNDIGLGEKPKGSLYVISETGDILIRHFVSACDPVCGISKCGLLAWINTGYRQTLFFSVTPPEFLSEINSQFKFGSAQKNCIKTTPAQ